MNLDVVSSTMANLLMCQNGSRFTFSHDCHGVLVGQILNTLGEKDPCGDFCQLPPVKVKESQLLYTNTGQWESWTTVTDSRMIQRLGDNEVNLGKKFYNRDCNKIHLRVIVSKVLSPKVDNDADISYTCSKNSERVSIYDWYFKRHITHFPLIDSDQNSPEHTVVIKADIQHAEKKTKTNVKQR